MAGVSCHCRHPENHQSGLPLQSSIPHPTFFQKCSQPFQAASDMERQVLSMTPASFLFSPFSPLLFLHWGHTGRSLSTHTPHHVSPLDASSPYPHPSESCLFAGRWKFKPLHTLCELCDLEQVTYVYWALISSFANRVIIVGLEGYFDGW